MALLKELKYVVKEGDDYSTISQNTGVDPNALYDVNGGAALNIGQTIALPPADQNSLASEEHYQSGHLPSNLIVEGGILPANPASYQSGHLGSNLVTPNGLLTANPNMYQSGHLKPGFQNFDYANFQGNLANLPGGPGPIDSAVSSAVAATLGASKWATWENAGIAAGNVSALYGYGVQASAPPIFGKPPLVMDFPEFNPLVPPTGESAPEWTPPGLPSESGVDPNSAFLWSDPTRAAQINMMGQIWRDTHPDETTAPDMTALYVSNKIYNEVALALTTGNRDDLPEYMSDHTTEIFYRKILDENGEPKFNSVEEFYKYYGYGEYANGYYQKLEDSGMNTGGGGHGYGRGYGYGYPSYTRGSGYNQYPGLTNWRISFNG